MSLAGKKFGPYRIAEEVGVGGLGRVYKGIDERTGRSVAVKFLHDKYTTNRKFLGIFHRELLIISSLHHKHIVSYLDSGFDPPTCYIVTEFVEGWSIHSFMKRVQRVPPLVALSIAIDMLQGIDYLHLHDTIHADLSSANVLIAKTGRVLVTDFGLAAQLDVEDYKNYMIGTPGYYSPEHLMEASITPQSDIYCVGLLLFEMIAGKKAVPALADRKKVLQSMRTIPLDLVRCADPVMERAVRDILREALQFSPGRRIQSADVFMYECYRVLKRYQIRYARYAIKKFLIDAGLSPGPFEGKDQEIYIGQAG
jgi:eukaryotic-like serine/threonine-protein kinase